MANPAPTINQINAFNATQGTTIDFNIIGGTELVRSNKIYIYDLSDNSLICTHLYTSTESIHELPANTDGSIVYESGKSSADFVNGAQYYAQIQTFTDIAGTQGGSGLSVAKMFWCLVDPTLTITTIPSTISTTSYNVSATYNANTSVVSNIIQQYQFSLYSATGSLLQSSGVVVGSGTQQGTSTTYDISYNFTGLSVGSSYYVTVEVTTTQGMNVNTQSNTFTVSIDTPTLGEATVVNNACDGYISVTSNLSGEYGGSGSGEIVSFETDSENVFAKLQVDLDPIQDLHGYDSPWVGGAGKNLLPPLNTKQTFAENGLTVEFDTDGMITINGTLNSGTSYFHEFVLDTPFALDSSMYIHYLNTINDNHIAVGFRTSESVTVVSGVLDSVGKILAVSNSGTVGRISVFFNGTNTLNNYNLRPMVCKTSTATSFAPYENICPISGHDEVDVVHTGVNVWDEEWRNGYYGSNGVFYATPSSPSNLANTNPISVKPNTAYYFKAPTTNSNTVCWYDADMTLISANTNTSFNTVITSPNNARYLNFKANYTGVTVSSYNNDISINYPSTDHEYHAYQGQTYNQEIEATLTPTVIDETPYLFKQTGDVRGDRESLELVGGTVNWNQLTEHEALNGTQHGISIQSNTTTGIVTITVPSNPTGYAQLGWSVYLVNGHKYLILSDKPLQSGIEYYTSGMAGKGISGNYSSPNNQQRISECSNTGNYYIYVYAGQSTASGTYKYMLQWIDLTAFFGNSATADYVYSLEQANAGAGIAWLRKYFPNLFAYSPYDTGTLESVKPTAHVTRGKNHYEINANNITLNGVTCVKNADGSVKLTGTATAGTFLHLSERGVYESPQALGYPVGVPFKLSGGISNSIRVGYQCRYGPINQFSTGTDYTITFEDTEEYIPAIYVANGTTTNITVYPMLRLASDDDSTWEAAVKHTYPITELELRGIPKLVDGELRFDGDTRKADGSNNVNRKFGIVEISSLPLQDNGSITGGRQFGAYVSGKKVGSTNIFSNAFIPRQNSETIGEMSGRESNTFVAFNSSITTLADFKTAMSGKYLMFELATPTTETAEPFTDPQEVSIYGTEEFVSSNGVPVGNKTTYKTRDIFGGTIDLASGVLTVDRVMVGGNSWVQYNASNGYKAYRIIDLRYGVPLGQSEPISNVISEFGSFDSSAMDRNIIQVPTSLVANCYLALEENLDPSIVYVAYKIKDPLTYQLTPHEIETLIGTNNVWSDAGDVLIEFNIPITNLLVKRQDVDDVSGNWLTLYSQPVEQASDMDFTFIDFLNQYGKTYKYALVPLLTQTQSGVEVEVEGGYTVSDEVQSIFDGVFIGDSTGVQRLKAGVAYNNLNTNQQVGVIPTLGNKYPVIVSNGNIQYDTGSVSGLIVPDDFYSNGNLSRIDMSDKRGVINDFITNKKPKILKDWNGNIWLVVFTDNVDVSFDNNYGMGVATFTSGWTEVGDPTNQEDLQRTGLIDVGGD